MKNPTMLYQSGDSLELNDGLTVDYVIVDADDVADALKKGWFKTVAEVFEEKPKAKRAPKTEVKADELD